MKDTQTFRRRKLIEEMTPQRKADNLASNTNDELSNIANGLSDSQTASELVAETVENKSNQIIQSIDRVSNKLDNVVAGTELSAEASEKTTNAVGSLQDVTTAMSEKLSKLSAMLSEKLVTATASPSASNDSTTLQALKDAMPIEVEQPKLQELLEKLVPQQPIPEDAPFLPPVVPPKNPEGKGGKDKKDKDKDNAFDNLFKTTKAGFKATVSVGDRIAGMLFRYTITAAAEAAKMAGMLFALVLGIDSIRVYFQYFMKKFDESWSKFDEKFKEWGPLISDLMIMAKNITNMFTEKNWLGLGKAVAQGISDFTTGMADLLLVGMAKLTATVLRAVGMDEKADALEGSVLQGYQDRTGASLDDKDQETLARYQDKQDQDKSNARKKEYERFKDKPVALEYAVKNGSVSKETADEINSGKMNFDFQNKPEAERLEAFKKRNEANAAIIRTQERTNKIMSPDAKDIANAKEAKADIDKRLSDPALKDVPNRLDTGKLLEKLDGSLKTFNERVPEAKPAPVTAKEDAQTVTRIDAAQKAKDSQVNNKATPTNVNQTNIMQKTSKTQYNMPPQSSTPAPGMQRSLGV